MKRPERTFRIAIEAEEDRPVRVPVRGPRMPVGRRSVWVRLVRGWGQRPTAEAVRKGTES